MIYCIGNGGSMAVAIHLASDLLNEGIPATALDNPARITAIANDYGYENIFSKQLEEHMADNKDWLICFSVSGKSPNILKAYKYAKKEKMSIIWLTSKDGYYPDAKTLKGLARSNNNDFHDTEAWFNYQFRETISGVKSY